MLEALEQRLPLAGDTFLVNFQLSGTDVPNRYFPDAGEVFGDRGNGSFYGWSSDHTDVSRDRGANPDQRLDTLVHFHEFQNWQFLLPNGRYEVTVSIGDPSNPSTHTLFVEGVNYWDAVPLSPNEFRTFTSEVTVADGRLTLDQGGAFEKATRINYVQIQGLSNGGNAAPAIPTITEPEIGTSGLNPTDVHMEAVGFSDPDGDSHRGTDWEIWTVGGGGERVWQILGSSGVERLHTHLGDGVFENSHAGRTDLLGNNDYELRVRFRDTAGAVSDWATRPFSTGPASTVYSLELDDVLAVPAPTWETTLGSNVILPPSSTPSSLFMGSSDGSLLLSVTANDGLTNSWVNPAGLPEHVTTRLVIQAGTDGLSLGDTDLAFRDGGNRDQTIFLPALNLASGERTDFWVDVAGATYYGNAQQTGPDFSLPARAATTPVPFVPLEPGFVVEAVAEGFQLPVNIAFVPDPGPAPDDPLFYVTELYGTVKVVTNNGSVSDYATNLLNFNPTGNFPGSGEQGLAGIVVDPDTGDVFATRVTSLIPFNDNSPHYPQVLRFTSSDGGRTADSTTVILDMVGESQGQSHQISNVSIGPDDKLYVHNGDGFNAATAQNLESFRGKILRMNLDGTAPVDNPYYNAANGITARDYVYAYGFRNPFGGAWRAADNRHYEVENGPSVDRLARVGRGSNFGWNGSDASMRVGALYNWDPAHAPVNITFVQPETFSGSQFPASMQDLAFVSESGPTYANGPQSRGKRIVYFDISPTGTLLDGPRTLVEYAGTGRATVVGLAAGPDGLYFTELYRDEDAVSPIDAGARVIRVRYVPPTPDGDFNDDAIYDCQDIDLLVAEISGGTNDPAFDLTGDRLVDADDLTAWLAEAGSVNLPSGNAFLFGDANLDGFIDVSDFNAWNSHKFSSLPSWCSGDFNADGFIDVSDFNLWNTNRFQSSDGGAPQRLDPTTDFLHPVLIVEVFGTATTDARQPLATHHRGWTRGELAEPDHLERWTPESVVRGSMDAGPSRCEEHVSCHARKPDEAEPLPSVNAFDPSGWGFTRDVGM